MNSHNKLSVGAQVLSLSAGLDISAGGRIRVRTVGDMIILDFPGIAHDSPRSPRQQPGMPQPLSSLEEFSAATHPLASQTSSLPAMGIALDDEIQPVRSETARLLVRANPDKKKDEIVLEIQDSAEKPARKCCSISKAVLIPALLAAGVEVADVMTSLISAKRSFAIIVPASITAYLTSFGLTGGPTESAFTEICEIIKNRGLPNNKPDEWPELSYGKELAALIMITILVSWATFSKFSQAYYLMNTIPGDYDYADSTWWKFVSGGFASGYTLTGLLTESLDSYKLIRKWLAGTCASYTNAAAKFAAFGIGAPFAVINAAQDVSQAVDTITDITRSKGMPGFAMMAGPSVVLDGGQKLAFEGRTVVNSMYNFVDHVQKVYRGEERIDPRSVIALMIAFGLSLFLEYTKLGINRSFYQQQADQFSLSGVMLAYTLLGLTWLTMFGGILIGTPSLYPEIHSVVNWHAKKLNSIHNSVRGYFKSDGAQDQAGRVEPVEAPAEPDEKTPLMSRDEKQPRAKSPYASFNHFNEISEKARKEKQEKQGESNAPPSRNCSIC